MIARLAIIFCAAWTFAAPALAEEVAAVDRFGEIVQPFLATHCMDCHSGDAAEGGLALDKLDSPATIAEQRKTWTKVLKMVRSGAMPPKGEERPEQKRVLAVSDWIDRELNNFDCTKLRDPGRVTIRRLNRVEYQNTVRDLVGVEYEATENFPSDEVGYGFDNIGDVLSTSPLLLEKYLAAAETISTQAIVLPESLKGMAVNLKSFSGSGQQRSGRLGFTTSGKMQSKVKLPSDGVYVIKVLAHADQAGDELAKLAIEWNGERRALLDVEAAADTRRYYSVSIQAAQGEHPLAVTFTTDFYDPGNPNPDRRDRNLWIDEVAIVGPLEETLADVPHSHRRLIPRRPSGESRQEQTHEIVRALARRAFRRPVTNDEADRLVKLVQLAERSGESFERGMQLALQAVLVSPHFLFRGEFQPNPDDPASTYVLGEYDLASRLSYFVWSSMPDEELLDLAHKAQLRRNLEKQVRRMLRDEKAQALVENFAGQWLEIHRLAEVAPNEESFPEFDAELRAAMQRETELFFAAIMREDRSVFELLDAPYTFLNQRLAEHYGIAGVQGDQFRRVELKEGRRGGVLTQASVLTVTSLPTRTSPVKRGKWILGQILGDEPPPPPPDVPELEEGKELTGSLRERLEQHRANPSCAACHETMDALGFAFENYDAIGAWRDRDGKHEIDPAGVLPDGTRFASAVELKKVLAARKEQFRRTLAEKMLTYALGRGLEYYDKCAIDRLTASMAENDDRFSSLIRGVVRSDPFQMRRGDGGKP